MHLTFLITFAIIVAFLVYRKCRPNRIMTMVDLLAFLFVNTFFMYNRMGEFELDTYVFGAALILPVGLTLTYYIIYATLYRWFTSVLIITFIIVYPLFLVTVAGLFFPLYAAATAAAGLNVFVSYKVANFFFFLFFLFYFFLLINVSRGVLANKITAL